MEKLVMLLDIYEEEVVGVHSVGEHITEKDKAWIISKKYGFIKWLVENDKIEYKNLNKIHTRKGLNVLIEQKLYEDLIMLLSIQDEPIEYLCKILK